jgi:hypothetical protein
MAHLGTCLQIVGAVPVPMTEPEKILKLTINLSTMER